MKIINNSEELNIFLINEGVLIDNDDITVIRYKSEPEDLDMKKIKFPCMCILVLIDEGCRYDYYDLYIINKEDFFDENI